MTTTNISGVLGSAYAPNVPCPDAGELVKSDQLKAVAQAITNQTIWLETDKASQSTGATFLDVVDTTATVLDMGITLERAIVYLSDADHTIDVEAGNSYVMLTEPAANRIITLRQSTAPIPAERSWIKLTVLIATSAFTVGVQREGSLDYVAVIGDGIGATGNQVASAKMKLQGGVWRLEDVGGRYVFYGIDA